MKIGIDIRNIGKQRTGSEAVVLNLTKNILKIDRENEYILLTDSTDKKIIDYIHNNLELDGKNNVKIVSLAVKNKFIWTAWSLPRWVRKNGLDIYHTEYILPFFMPKQTKLITHIHDVSFKVYRQMISWRDIFFLDILIPWTIRRADKIIAVSKFTYDEIIKYFPKAKGKITIVYNAVAINNSLQRSEEVRKKYNLPKKYILYIGTLQPRKNVAILIEAYLKNKKKLGDIGLVIAGNLQAHNIDKRISKISPTPTLPQGGRGQKEVAFPGFIAEKDKLVLIAKARAFVYPSLYEGFGIPILEAMSQGVPVLASDILSHKEVGGKACLYFKPKDLDDLAEKMYDVCIDEKLRERLINLENERFKRFSWQKSAKKMLRIYEEMT